jgi:23S rRNA (adenine2503-C2)-methyltransferase
VNDGDEDARRLARLVRGVPSKVNLIAFNECPGLGFRRPEEARVEAFQKILLGQDVTAVVRRSRGRDIAAACGQLALLPGGPAASAAPATEGPRNPLTPPAGSR